MPDCPPPLAQTRSERSTRRRAGEARDGRTRACAVCRAPQERAHRQDRQPRDPRRADCKGRSPASARPFRIPSPGARCGCTFRRKPAFGRGAHHLERSRPFAPAEGAVHVLHGQQGDDRGNIAARDIARPAMFFADRIAHAFPVSPAGTGNSQAGHPPPRTFGRSDGPDLTSDLPLRTCCSPRRNRDR